MLLRSFQSLRKCRRPKLSSEVKFCCLQNPAVRAAELFSTILLNLTGCATFRARAQQGPDPVYLASMSQ